MTPGTDGGYYAIKGFSYQFDKTILEILGRQDPDEPVGFERVEDIDSSKSVLQVKYKETARLTPSALRKPVISLLNGFRTDRNRTYELYVYFENFAGFGKNIDDGRLELDVLNRVLGSDHSFDSATVEAFQAKFQIGLGGTFLEQLKTVLERLRSLDGVNGPEDAVLAHSVLSTKIAHLIADAKPAASDRRQLSKNQVQTLIGNAFQHRFTAAYQEYVGKKKYLSQIERKFLRPEQRHHNLFALGDGGSEGIICLGELVEQISSTLFTSALCDYKPPTFVIGDDSMSDVKIYLVDHDLDFNDGYKEIKLSKKALQKNPIIKRLSAGKGKAQSRLENASFKARLVSESDFLKYQDAVIPAIDRAYFFGVNSEISESIVFRSSISVDGLGAIEIKELVNGR